MSEEEFKKNLSGDYKNNSLILNEEIDGESDWYYYPSRDHEWIILTSCWDDHKKNTLKN